MRAGLPLVTLVYVALCSNAQIHCGGQGAGDPASPSKNLYWGRAFGARRHFDETARSWRRVALSQPDEVVLEQAVYSRRVSGRPWSHDADVEQVLLLRAVHGEAIETAIDDFWESARTGAHVRWREGQTERAHTVHVVGYAGHNRLMDGFRLRRFDKRAASAIPAFVFACRSDQYFSETLREAGVRPLVMTRDLMAPEGYVIAALVGALGENVSVAEIRRRVVAAYARYQRIPERVAGTIFAR